MKRTLLFLGSLLFVSGCGSSATSNIIPVIAGNCGVGSYPNQPCVSVSICSPGTNNCQTIPNVLLDTGSYGLRVFASVVTVQLPQVSAGQGMALGECVQYLGQTADWGSVRIADVQLGSDTAASLPIQLIDPGFSRLPSSCANTDTSPQSAGFNGILGVGLLAQDCGPSCAQAANNGIYFSCGAAGCQGVAVPLQQQVSNPIPFLNQDNNGFAIAFPAVPTAGAPTATGAMILGIGTQSNNTPSGVTTLAADSNANFLTQFAGKTFSSAFIDSGTDGLIFPALAQLPACGNSSAAAGFFCPNAPVSLTAIQAGANGVGQVQVPFTVYNAQAALGSNNLVFSDIAGAGSNEFIWGFPIFLGRVIYFGMEGKSSQIGQGPYWAL